MTLLALLSRSVIINPITASTLARSLKIPACSVSVHMELDAEVDFSEFHRFSSSSPRNESVHPPIFLLFGVGGGSSSSGSNIAASNKTSIGTSNPC